MKATSLVQLVVRNLVKAALAVSLLGVPMAPATEVVQQTGSLGNAQIKDLHAVHDQEQLSKYQRLCGSAEKAIAEGDHSKAFKILNEARKLEPKSVDAYLIYTRLHLAREEYPSAEKAANYAVEVAPMSAVAWYQHSRVQYLKGEYGIAQEAAQNATKYMTKPSWEFYHWLGVILEEGGKLAVAEQRFAQAQAVLESDLENLETGIRMEESKQVVTGMDSDTELVTLMGGEVVEREVVRLQKEYKEAPEEWHQMKKRLNERLQEVSFDRYRMLVELGEAEAGKELVSKIFSDAMLQYLNGEYEAALKEFNNTRFFFEEADDSELAAYLVCLALVGEDKAIERARKRLSDALKTRDSAMLQELFTHLKKAAPQLDPIKTPKGVGGDLEAAGVHRALFHIGQGFPELAAPLLQRALAAPLLQRALASGTLTGFELKAVTVLSL